VESRKGWNDGNGKSDRKGRNVGKEWLVYRKNVGKGRAVMERGGNVGKERVGGKREKCWEAEE
jgi:hypothetical protein